MYRVLLTQKPFYLILNIMTIDKIVVYLINIISVSNQTTHYNL